MDYNTLIVIGISIGVGCLIALGAAFLGAWMVFRVVNACHRAKDGGLFSVQEPKGDVFTVPDVDDASLFPEDDKENADEKHILQKTDEFLRTFEEK